MNDYNHPSLQSYPRLVKISHATPNNQDIFRDHQHCSESTSKSSSRQPTPSPITSQLPWTSAALPDHSKTIVITTEPKKLFQAFTDLFQPHHQEFAVRIHKLEMNKDLAYGSCLPTLQLDLPLFLSKDTSTLIRAYNTYVRHLLEYNSVI